MSRDQKPGKAKIVVNAPPRSLAAITSSQTQPDRPVTAKPAKPAQRPVLLLAGVFLITCAAAGAGVALLPWMST
jgi:hypothetical protein